MIGMFVLMALAFGAASAISVWWAFSARRSVEEGFARLIDAEGTHWRVERGRLTTFASGRYRDRQVTLQLFHPQADEGPPGEVVLTMGVRAPDSEAWKSSLATFRNPDLSRATFDLEGRFGLELRLTDGALKASSTSAPGWMVSRRFDEERWRKILAQMHVVANWLETRAQSQTE